MKKATLVMLMLSAMTVYAQVPKPAPKAAGAPAPKAAAATADNSAPDITVKVKSVNDVRRTDDDGFPKPGLEIKFKVSGVSSEKVKEIECNVKEAADDTGKSLVKTQKGFFDSDKTSFSDNTESAEVEVTLKNPSRKATTFAVSGTIGLYMPDADPSSIVKITNPKKSAGTPVQSTALQLVKASVVIGKASEGGTAPKGANPGKARAKPAGEGKSEDGADVGEAVAQGMQEAFSGMFSRGSGPNSISIQITDPSEKIKAIEFFDAAGKKIDTQGGGSMGDVKTGQTRSIDFNSPLPENAEMRIYVATPKALKQVPFSIPATALP